ncbi:hypothetical protein ACFQ1I_46810 [Kitasatospora arboriphila]
MRDHAIAREVTLDQAAAHLTADRDQWFHGHRGWLREPEEARPTAADETQRPETAARTHAPEQLARHHAALAAARAQRDSTAPLRPGWKPTRHRRRVTPPSMQPQPLKPAPP